MKLDSKRRETLSKLLSNLAVFWLTALPVSILTNFGIEQGAIVPLVAVACAGVVLGFISVLVSKDEKKTTADEQTPPPAVDRAVRGRRKRK